MTKLEQAARRAVAWLSAQLPEYHDVLKDLVEALAEQAEQRSDSERMGPVAWLWRMHGWAITAHGKHRAIKTYVDVCKPPVETQASGDFIDLTPLYAAPVEPVKQVPLSTNLTGLPTNLAGLHTNQTEQEPVAHELRRNKAEREYFNARPQIDTLDRRNVFRAGFDAFANAGKPIIEPVKQEPIGYTAKQYDGDYNGNIIYEHKHKEHFVPVYAAPVRTKDLTPEEILNALAALPISRTRLDEARAVIAADRELNK